MISVVLPFQNTSIAEVKSFLAAADNGRHTPWEICGCDGFGKIDSCVWRQAYNDISRTTLDACATIARDAGATALFIRNANSESVTLTF